ncbi:MAG: twin-arginine translocation signal domain-containing protein, partial [Planctomycetaceae bacterium]
MTHTVSTHADSSQTRHARADRWSRRRFLRAAAMLGGAAWLAPGRGFSAEEPGRRPRVAVVMTVFTYRSHAHVILENFLEPYLFNGRRTEPGVEVVSFYVDQFPKDDMARDVARRYGVPIFGTIGEALCVGGKELAVDAVLSIGEHGDYPVNELGQREYPRKRFFDESVAVMRRSGRSVPFFNDKHLSYRWDWAKAMYDTAGELRIPLMAGSSVPLAERRPPLEIPAGAEIEEAVSIHGGPVESYDFHGLEVLQSLVEFRKGGETGVERVEFLSGDALWQAADAGRWSRDLAEAAMSAELGDRAESLTRIPDEGESTPHGILLTYKDGLRGTVLKIGQSAIRWNFACRLKG